MSQTDMNLMFQSITGHGLFGKHLRHWNKTICNKCQICKDKEEEPWHLWTECIGLVQERQNRQKEENVPDEVKVLRFFKISKISKLMDDRSKDLNSKN